MFGKKIRPDVKTPTAILADLEREADTAAQASGQPEAPGAAEIPRRVRDARTPATPAVPARSEAGEAGETGEAGEAPDAAEDEATSGDHEGRKLVVGREIHLAGEITTCDKLVVEGRVEADLNESQVLEIAESGLYKGSASVQDAEISGRFEGELTVHGRLLIRSTGQVDGILLYSDLEVERGGRIRGDIELLDQARPPMAEAITKISLGTTREAESAPLPTFAPAEDDPASSLDDLFPGAPEQTATPAGRSAPPAD